MPDDTTTRVVELTKIVDLLDQQIHDLRQEIDYLSAIVGNILLAEEVRQHDKLFKNND
jgi:hypothetical protein